MPEWGTTLITVSWIFLGVMAAFFGAMVIVVLREERGRRKKDARPGRPEREDPLPRH